MLTGGPPAAPKILSSYFSSESTAGPKVTPVGDRVTPAGMKSNDGRASFSSSLRFRYSAAAKASMSGGRDVTARPPTVADVMS